MRGVGTEKISDTIVKNLSVITSNRVLLYDSVSAGQIQLPLSQLSDTSMFYFYFDSIAIDTFWIYVQRRVEMISPECGYNTKFILDSVINTFYNIEKTIIIDKIVGEESTTGKNINIIIKKRSQ